MNVIGEAIVVQGAAQVAEVINTVNRQCECGQMVRTASVVTLNDLINNKASDKETCPKCGKAE